MQTNTLAITGQQLEEDQKRGITPPFLQYFPSRQRRTSCLQLPFYFHISAAKFEPTQEPQVDEMEFENQTTTRTAYIPPTDTSFTRPDFIPFTVPYLCADAPYDYKPGGFRDFPERRGWILYGEPGKPDMTTFARLDGADVSLMAAETVAFLQAWFFFGVLAEASSIYGLDVDVESEFVSNSKDGKVISTELLNGLTKRWLEAALMQDDWKDRHSRVRELCDYLKCRMFNLRGDNWSIKARRCTYEECRALLSIEIVFRALLLVLVRSGEYGATIIEPFLKTNFFDYQLKLWIKSRWALLKQGWCESELRILASLNRELPYGFFGTALKRQRMDHSNCGQFRCMADQINEDTYQTVHVEPGCECGLASADVDELCSTLSRGRVPIIMVSDDLQLRVVEDHQFVAISHVCKYNSISGAGNSSKFWPPVASKVSQFHSVVPSPIPVSVRNGCHERWVWKPLKLSLIVS